MTIASAIRSAAPLLLVAALAGGVVPYDTDDIDPYYSEPYYGGNTYRGSYSIGKYFGGDEYVVKPSRPHRIHRHDRHGDFRHRRRTHERSGLGQSHRRDRATDWRHRERSERRAVAERPDRRAERQPWERRPAQRRYDDYRGSDNADATFARRDEDDGHQAERERRTLKRILAEGALAK